MPIETSWIFCWRVINEARQKNSPTGETHTLRAGNASDGRNLPQFGLEAALKYLATRIKKELREKDLIVRTGGDEFLIYLNDIGDQAHGDSIIGRIHEKISTRYRLEDLVGSRQLSLKVACSMGVAFFPQNGKSVETLMARADEALLLGNLAEGSC